MGGTFSAGGRRGKGPISKKRRYREGSAIKRQRVRVKREMRGTLESRGRGSFQMRSAIAGHVDKREIVPHKGEEARQQKKRTENRHCCCLTRSYYMKCLWERQGKVQTKKKKRTDPPHCRYQMIRRGLQFLTIN